MGKAAKQPSFEIRVAKAGDIETIRALVAEMRAVAKRARSSGDQTTLRAAIGRQMVAERRGGALLLSGVKPATETGMGPGTVQRWRRLARLSNEIFEAAAEAGDRFVGKRPPPQCVDHIIMIVSEFKRDARGNLCRKITAVAAPPSRAP